MYLLFSPSMYFVELCDYVVVWLQAEYASELQPIWELLLYGLYSFGVCFLLVFFLSFFFFLKEVFYERFFFIPLSMLATCPK